MPISITRVFLAVGVPGLVGCSGPWLSCPEPVEGETRSIGLSQAYFDAIAGEDGVVSEDECIEACHYDLSIDDATECVVDDPGEADTADTGAVAELTCVGTYVPICEGGRRPPGLRPLRGGPLRSGPLRGSRGGAAPSALHRMAWMEAASVHAFVRLHRELMAHGAPGSLATRCLSAARDEVEHARAIARLAGVPVPRPDVAPLPLRDLDALALDNAVEGCVHETWAAVEAHLRATRGRDRATWARIAADETRHAQLAWDIDAWLAERGVARPDARRKAADRLVRGVKRPARGLAGALRSELWAG